MVQHKQTRELYALKYINKSKCVKMKAVANIIQERRLLEEVRRFPSFATLISLLSITDRPSLCCQPSLCFPRRRKLLLCSRSHARR